MRWEPTAKAEAAGATVCEGLATTEDIGRSGEIRTPDPLLPKQVRYQAALRSEDGNYTGFLL